MKNIFSSWRKKSSKFSKFRKFRKSRFFLKTQHFDILKNFRILRFLKISKVFKIFENFENFWDFENFENFWKVVDRKNFQPNNFRFFFDDLFRSQISPRFQKSHLENRGMSSKMWKSYVAARVRSVVAARVRSVENPTFWPLCHPGEPCGKLKNSLTSSRVRADLAKKWSASPLEIWICLFYESKYWFKHIISWFRVCRAVRPETLIFIKSGQCCCGCNGRRFLVSKRATWVLLRFRWKFAQLQNWWW